MPACDGHDIGDPETTPGELDHIFHAVKDRVTLRNMPQPVTTAPPATPRATDRGLSLLRAIADRPDGRALADLARDVELNASTALRQLRSLEAAGFARRLADGTWGPGAELLRIARNLAATATLPRLAAPVLASLADAVGESAYLAEADGQHAVYVAMESGSHALRHVSWLGHRVPRRGTAVGRALRGDVDADGVAMREDAVENGITAVSAPIRDTNGTVMAAISVVGPSFRLHGEALATTRTLVATHATRLSHLAGAAIS